MGTGSSALPYPRPPCSSVNRQCPAPQWVVRRSRWADAAIPLHGAQAAGASLAAVLARAVQEGVEGRPEVLADLLLQRQAGSGTGWPSSRAEPPVEGRMSAPPGGTYEPKLDQEDSKKRQGCFRLSNKI